MLYIIIKNTCPQNVSILLKKTYDLLCEHHNLM